MLSDDEVGRWADPDEASRGRGVGWSVGRREDDPRSEAGREDAGPNERVMGRLTGGLRAVDVGVDEWEGEGSWGRGSRRVEAELELDGTEVGDDEVRWSTGEGASSSVLEDGPGLDEDDEDEDAIEEDDTARLG